MKKISPFILIALLAFASTASAEYGADFRGTTSIRPSVESFTLTYEDVKIPVSSDQLVQWQLGSGISQNLLTSESATSLDLLVANYTGVIPFGANIGIPTSHEVNFNIGSIYQYVKTNTAFLKQQDQEPYLEIKNNRAVKFTPPKDGISPDAYKTTFNIAEALQQHATSTEIVMNHVSPRMSLSETNALGITELIAQGTSTFRGSPSNRRHNIKVGVEKEKGTIIAPGAEFSFNKFLGPVDGEHGFLPELVIKATGTIPEFGGGLCQVSSTAFRAAMQAGFPITQRRNHAYAVQYYAPQGTDATIYPGVIDLKFINDSPGSILIWPYFKDDNTLVFDFYGTKDDRQVTLGKPYQYDKKTDGSMKATWEREVTKNGETKKDVFNSTYRSPALYHKTEEFASSTPEGIHVGNTSTTITP